MVLIGQRMPVLLTALGLIVAALLLPRLRLVAIAALVAGGIVLAASPVISPPTYYRLVEKFSTQMEHFKTTPYGYLLRRGDEITEQHPWFGRGFDGFRTGCPMHRYFRGWQYPEVADIGMGPDICKQHPHNFYLQASTDGGYPGLVCSASSASSGSAIWEEGCGAARMRCEPGLSSPPSFIFGRSPPPAPSPACR